MSSGFNPVDNTSSTSPKKQRSSFIKDLPGKITATIGSGENARNTFVYLTLRWAFISGVIITILIVINNWYFVEKKKVPDIMGDIKSCWEIIIPLITLALRYAFGKSKE